MVSFCFAETKFRPITMDYSLWFDQNWFMHRTSSPQNIIGTIIILHSTLGVLYITNVPIALVVFVIP